LIKDAGSEILQIILKALQQAGKNRGRLLDLTEKNCPVQALQKRKNKKLLDSFLFLTENVLAFIYPLHSKDLSICKVIL
jgi:hypothetical protein